jgi:PPOX class probable F420-dependent enzyme
MTLPTFESLAAGKYLSLTTFKKDGTAVATPVGLAADGDRLYVITDASAGKAKRLRNSGRVLLASCDMRGRFEGEQVEGSARVLEEPADVAAVVARIKGRYGVQYTLATLGSKLRRTTPDQVGIEIEVVPGGGPSAP